MMLRQLEYSPFSHSHLNTKQNLDYFLSCIIHKKLKVGISQLFRLLPYRFLDSEERSVS